MKRSTKRYIFLFCWWLGLVVIWMGFFFTLREQPSYVLIHNEWFAYWSVYFDPFFIVPSFPLWWILRKYFPGFKNWGWVVAMPFLAEFGYWSLLFIYAGITGALGGRG